MTLVYPGGPWDWVRLSGSPPGVVPRTPWGVLGADRAPALPKLLDDLPKTSSLEKSNANASN